MRNLETVIDDIIAATPDNHYMIQRLKNIKAATQIAEYKFGLWYQVGNILDRYLGVYHTGMEDWKRNIWRIFRG
jgi:hypothetical protein